MVELVGRGQHSVPSECADAVKWAAAVTAELRGDLKMRIGLSSGRLQKAPEGFLDREGVTAVMAEARQGRRDFIRNAFAAATVGAAAPVAMAQGNPVPKEGVEDGVVFDGRGNEVPALGAEESGGAEDGEVVGLGATTGEDDLAGLAGPEPGHAVAGVVEEFAGLASEMVDAGRIGPAAFEGCEEGFADDAVERGGGVVVAVDPLHGVRRFARAVSGRRARWRRGRRRRGCRTWGDSARAR